MIRRLGKDKCNMIVTAATSRMDWMEHLRDQCQLRRALNSYLN